GEGRSLTLFNSVNLNFLRTEALSFYKVPFVVCFCIRLLLSQDWLLFVQYRGDAFRRFPVAPPALLRPSLSFSFLLAHSQTCKQPQQPIPGGEDATQGALWIS
ncbi:hypothetical protein AMECASPLE_008864, partial [Ameca splendens]